jgi:hypothetical protein
MSSASAPVHGLATGREPGPAGAQLAVRRFRWPAAAGAGYLAAWVAGLAVWPSNLAVNAASSQVSATYQAHHAVAAAQYLLVEGLAGLLLGAVLAAVLRATARGSRLAGARPAAVLGAVAVLISLLQCVLGQILVASASDAGRAGTLFALINRLDGVKMLALAGTAAWLAARRGLAVQDTGARFPRWLRIAAGLAAVALAGSGVAYLLLAQSAAGLVYASGPLLLLWISATGGWLTVSHRRAAA